MDKICTKCNLPKILDEFGKDKNSKNGYNYWCKLCVKEYYKINRTEHLIRTKNYQDQNKEKIYNKSKIWYKNNKIDHKKRMEKWRNDNPEYFIDYFQDNKKERNAYKNNKYHNDINYRIRIKIKDRVQKALKNNIKRGRTLELIGCSVEQYRNHIESQFKPEMNWSNHGEIWEIDHIKPCDSFNLENFEEQCNCFNYLNTQPLFKTTEIAKSFGYINEIGNRDKSSKFG